MNELIKTNILAKDIEERGFKKFKMESKKITIWF